MKRLFKWMCKPTQNINKGDILLFLILVVTADVSDNLFLRILTVTMLILWAFMHRKIKAWINK